MDGPSCIVHPRDAVVALDVLPASLEGPTVVTIPSLSPKHSGISAKNVFIVVVLNYFLPVSAVVMLVAVRADLWSARQRQMLHLHPFQAAHHQHSSSASHFHSEEF